MSETSQEKKPLSEIPRTSHEPTVGRDVHVYGPWEGPRPGKVVRVTGDLHGHPTATLFVLGDQTAKDGFLTATRYIVPVLDPIDPASVKIDLHAQWMPWQHAQHAAAKSNGKKTA